MTPDGVRKLGVPAVMVDADECRLLDPDFRFAMGVARVSLSSPSVNDESNNIYF